MEEVGPGEFDEFGFSARMPEGEGPIVFEAIQTYDSGEVVRWVGPADADEPMPTASLIKVPILVTVFDLAAKHLTVLI